MRRWLFIGCVAIVAVGAAGAAGITGPELAAAKKLYLTKCAKCHKLYDPVNYPDEDWDRWMLKMAKKAKLKPAQAEAVARYAETLRQPGGTNASAVK